LGKQVGMDAFSAAKDCQNFKNICLISQSISENITPENLSEYVE
jgi:hypothetical protein